MSNDIIAAQSASLEPERFQRTLIESMTSALMREQPPPCLLRAPTASGKTFVMSHVLANVSAEREVVWFWFVPFVNLVQQTEDQLAANCAGVLTSGMLDTQRNQEPSPGMVLLSTAAAVSRAQNRAKGYDADANDETRSIAAFVARARVRGLEIGLIVDEAHIGLDKATEFGRFAAWLQPAYLIAATATPKDQRLGEFVAQAGLSAVESFTVSRADVVNARLNKRYIEAIIYQSPSGLHSLADSKRTVLRQAWKRNVTLRKELLAAGIDIEPLLLVQVGNGDEAVEEARQDLMSLCKVPMDAIGVHSAAEPDPVLMASIANDSTKRVLVFKQSAGTGFDAPRAFVLASTKPVNDPDFATQFIGRVMRVLPQVRSKFPKPTPVPLDLDTAYIYLANAEAQTGFQQSVEANARIKSELEGQTERLVVRETVSGAMMITSRPTPQAPVLHSLPFPSAILDANVSPMQDASIEGGQMDVAIGRGVSAMPHEQSPLDLFSLASDDETILDEAKPAAPSVIQRSKGSLASAEDLVGELAEQGLQAYRIRREMRSLPTQLKREERPHLANMSAISTAVANRLDIPESVRNTAIAIALNRAKGIERTTELTSGVATETEVAVVTDRVHLAADAREALRALPQTEEADHRIIIDTLAHRLIDAIRDKFEGVADEDQPTQQAFRQHARDAAFWVVLKQADLLRESLHDEIAKHSKVVNSGPLPDAMLFPTDLPLDRSRKNIYGVLPPSKPQLEASRGLLLIDSAAWFDDKCYSLANGTSFVTSAFDESSKLNGFERQFAEALDRAPFVQWWHRNADRKPYCVAIVRADHRHYFYPDFVVCLEHSPGDAPLQRLVETKDNTKDAARKAKHTPEYYGSVLFITQDGQRIKIINYDGSLGAMVDTDDLSSLRESLRASRPTV
ncbi:MAG: DEAD/DEAH box helicase family protein [Casimicrobium sp.]